MITDEKLRAVVSYTTPGGTALSWNNNVDLTIKDTSYGPQTYDIYVDQNRGGANVSQNSGLFIKKPISLYKAFKEQYPSAVTRNGDTYNLRIASNVAIVGTHDNPYSSSLFYPNEFEAATVNMDNGIDQLMINNNGLMFQDPYFAIVELVRKHDQGQYSAFSATWDFDFHKRYGRFLINNTAYHGTGTFRLVIYNANGSVASDTTLTGYNSWITILKGQYARLYASYTPSGISSKNNVFWYFAVKAINGVIPPAVFISDYFNSTHTVNIYNDGYILGKGGEGISYTPEPYSTDIWNREIQMMVKEDFIRNNAGGDAILAADVGVVNIFNNGVISGGGAGSEHGHISQGSGNSTYYAAPGGAPLGLGTVTYSRYSAGGSGGVLPFIYGAQAGLLTAAPNGAGLGESIINRNGSGGRGGYYYFAGMHYRGCRNVNFYGGGQYKGPNCLSTQLMNLVG